MMFFSFGTWALLGTSWIRISEEFTGCRKVLLFKLVILQSLLSTAMKNSLPNEQPGCLMAVKEGLKVVNGQFCVKSYLGRVEG